MASAQRHGPEPEWMENRGEWLHNWISEGGSGMLGLYWHDVPDMCLDFIMCQMTRFNIPFNKDILDVLRVGAYASFSWCDIQDPYCLFWGVSDVNLTDDWSQNTYELHDLWGHQVSKEADPEYLETFVYVPGQCEAVFEEHLAKPGLLALPNCAGHGISDLLCGEYNGEECWDGIDSTAHNALVALCTNPDGSVDKRRMMAYFELAAWAGFLWLAGPYGREFRREHNLIMDTAIQFGESILLEGSIITPENYRKYPRPPQSCYRCGVPAWCVELTQDMGTTRYVCMACTHAGLPPLSAMHCGSTYCKYSSCPHNPFHTHGQAGIYAAARHNGQLLGMARGGQASILLRGDKQLRLSSG